METNTEKHPLQILLEESDCNVRSYSGRGMSGKECLGVTIRRGGMGCLVSTVIEEIAERSSSSRGYDERFEISEAFRNMSTDSMGTGEIVYFPGVPFVEDDEEEEEDDE